MQERRNPTRAEVSGSRYFVIIVWILPAHISVAPIYMSRNLLSERLNIRMYRFIILRIVLIWCESPGFGSFVLREENTQITITDF